MASFQLIKNIFILDSLVDVYVKSRHPDSSSRVAIEIVTPCLTLVIEKFDHFRPNEKGFFFKRFVCATSVC